MHQKKKKGIYYFLFSDVDLSGFTGIKCKFSLSVWINTVFSLCVFAVNTLRTLRSTVLSAELSTFFFF